MEMAKCEQYMGLFLMSVSQNIIDRHKSRLCLHDLLIVYMTTSSPEMFIALNFHGS